MYKQLQKQHTVYILNTFVFFKLSQHQISSKYLKTNETQLPQRKMS